MRITYHEYRRHTRLDPAIDMIQDATGLLLYLHVVTQILPMKNLPVRVTRSGIRQPGLCFYNGIGTAAPTLGIHELHW